MMGKIVLCFTVMNTAVKIHVEFKDPIPFDEMPRTVLECPQENLLENLEAQVWVQEKKSINVLEGIADVEEQEDDEEEQETS